MVGRTLKIEEFMKLVQGMLPEGSEVVKGEECVLPHGILSHERKIAWLIGKKNSWHLSPVGKMATRRIGKPIKTN